MSKMHKFDCGDGSTVSLNSLQLQWLLKVPTTHMPFATFWALRHRCLIHGPQHYLESQLTFRGEAVVEHYRRICNGSKT